MGPRLLFPAILLACARIVAGQILLFSSLSSFMLSKFERTPYGWPYLLFIWLFGILSLWLVYQLSMGQGYSVQAVNPQKVLHSAVFLLLLMVCVFLRYRPTRSGALSSEDALNVCVILVFDPGTAIVIMALAAILNTLSQLANRTVREVEYGPWYANLGEVFFQGGLMAFVTLTGSSVYRVLNSGDWIPFTTLEPRQTASIPFVYASIGLIRWNLMFVHAWTRGTTLLEYNRNLRELRSFVVLLTEISNGLLGVVMAVVYFLDFKVFCALGVVLVSLVALLSKQARVTNELQSTVLELKILASLGKALSNATQTRKELLKALYEHGKELFGADSFAIYLFPEHHTSTDQNHLQLEGVNYRMPRLHRRQTDHSGTGKLHREAPGSDTKTPPGGTEISTGKTGELLNSGRWSRQEQTPGEEIPPEENAIGLAEWCVKRARPLRLDDITKEANAYGYSWLIRQLPYRSWLGVPLELKDRPLGVISVASESRAAFTEQHQALLQTLGQQVVSALENARLFELATIDGLTGLINPRYLRQKLAEQFEQAKRTHKPLSVVMIDLDHFKKINDTYGHEVGNDVLRYLAALVKSRLRDSDIPARYGGEEFTVLLPNTPADPSRDVAERLRIAIESAPAPTSAGPIKITASIGVANYPALNVADQDELVTAADKALYASKQNGRNRITDARFLT